MLEGRQFILVRTKNWVRGVGFTHKKKIVGLLSSQKLGEKRGRGGAWEDQGRVGLDVPPVF